MKISIAKNCWILLALFLLIPLRSGWSQDSVKVSRKVIVDCVVAKEQLSFVTAQRDSLATRPRITLKEKSIYFGSGALTALLAIIILRQATGR